MGVLQIHHPLPIKTDSDNNTLIFSPELDGPAHAARPISSRADLSALQSLPLKLRRPSSAHVPGWPDFPGWADSCSRAGREATPWAGLRRAAGFGVLSNSDIVPRSYW